MGIPERRQPIINLEQFIDRINEPDPEVDKDQLILDLCRGRTVLDLGCIDHDVQTALDLGDEWLHARIRRVAAETVGLDILEDDAKKLNELGYRIEIGNAESFDLGRTFDVVVAGDLIEHLSNIGMFLDAVSRHMSPESLFVVTTPNAFNVEQVLQGVFRKQTMVNTQHAVEIDPKAMFQLVSRSPLEIVGFHWIDTRFHFRLRGGRFLRRIVNPISESVMKRRPLVRRDYAVYLQLRD